MLYVGSVSTKMNTAVVLGKIEFIPSLLSTMTRKQLIKEEF